MTAPNTSEEQPPSPGHWGTSSDLGQVNDLRAGGLLLEDIHLAAGNKWSEIVRRHLQRTGPEIEIQAKLSWELGSRTSTTGREEEEEGLSGSEGSALGTGAGTPFEIYLPTEPKRPHTGTSTAA